MKHQNLHGKHPGRKGGGPRRCQHRSQLTLSGIDASPAGSQGGSYGFYNEPSATASNASWTLFKVGGPRRCPHFKVGGPRCCPHRSQLTLSGIDASPAGPQEKSCRFKGTINIERGFSSSPPPPPPPPPMLTIKHDYHRERHPRYFSPPRARSLVSCVRARVEADREAQVSVSRADCKARVNSSTW